MHTSAPRLPAVTAEIESGSRTIISDLLSPILKYGHDSLRER
jgi:hypothetical protein